VRRALITAVLALAACEARVVDEGFDFDIPEFRSLNLPAYFDCLRERGLTAVSAHRGGPSPGFAENAIATFDNTVRAAPFTFLEVDIGQTADGVLVLMHDDRVNRTTSGAGALNELSLAELQAFTLEDEDGRPVSARVPTLREALEWAEARAVLELDVKRGVAYEDVVREVEAAGAMGRVIFITYSIEGASRLAALAPEAMIYTTISNARELDVLEGRGVDLSRIVAWTGTTAPDAGLVDALAARGVEARFGMFGEGRDYANVTRARAQIVAVDDAAEAFRDIDAADGENGFAALRCVGAQ
jgi:glycerophosphoryl diester phosphodiesterase